MEITILADRPLCIVTKITYFGMMCNAGCKLSQMYRQILGKKWLISDESNKCYH